MAHVEYDGDDMIQVQLLDCDSINQAKEKILNVIYKVNIFPILGSSVILYSCTSVGAPNVKFS